MTSIKKKNVERGGILPARDAARHVPRKGSGTRHNTHVADPRSTPSHCVGAGWLIRAGVRAIFMRVIVGLGRLGGAAARRCPATSGFLV